MLCTLKIIKIFRFFQFNASDGSFYALVVDSSRVNVQ